MTSQTIVLHTHNAKPFAIDSFVSPIPSDGSCPKSTSKSTQNVASKSPFAAFAQNFRALNTTILLESTHTPPLYEITPIFCLLPLPTHSSPYFRPELRKPPPITPAGQPIQPVPEKSFIQKYWMYMATIVVVLSTYLLQRTLQRNLISPFLV